jgi:hypothetical protein
MSTLPSYFLARAHALKRVAFRAYRASCSLFGGVNTGFALALCDHMSTAASHIHSSSTRIHTHTCLQLLLKSLIQRECLALKRLSLSSNPLQEQGATEIVKLRECLSFRCLRVPCSASRGQKSARISARITHWSQFVNLTRTIEW